LLARCHSLFLPSPAKLRVILKELPPTLAALALGHSPITADLLKHSRVSYRVPDDAHPLLIHFDSWGKIRGTPDETSILIALPEKNITHLVVVVTSDLGESPLTGNQELGDDLCGF
jgi:hypothetical protein